MKPKYFIGPMSKNIVDAIIEFCNETNNIIGLIPSRRQIENTGGYVNNWTTKDFSEYVKSKTDKILLVRDHSGPNQGQTEDDGYESLKEDCKYLDVIHIDPWKKYPSFDLGLKETIQMIEYCYKLNPNIQYEVGTEEAIRRFEPYELSDLLYQLGTRLTPEIAYQIKYLVIQSGTSLKGTNQTGNYDSARLKEMIEVCNQNSITSKEHNGDYIPVSTIKEKFDLGLNSINIAPEFGLIETLTYIKEIETNWDFSLMDRFWEICYNSKKWEKWVNQDFNPQTQKRELIKICGHYVLSHPEFIKDIKSKLPNIDIKVKSNINNKLRELYGC
jgi:hypothetical protein